MNEDSISSKRFAFVSIHFYLNRIKMQSLWHWCINGILVEDLVLKYCLFVSRVLSRIDWNVRNEYRKKLRIFFYFIFIFLFCLDIGYAMKIRFSVNALTFALRSFELVAFATRRLIRRYSRCGTKIATIRMNFAQDSKYSLQFHRELESKAFGMHRFF